MGLLNLVLPAHTHIGLHTQHFYKAISLYIYGQLLLSCDAIFKSSITWHLYVSFLCFLNLIKKLKIILLNKIA